MPFKPGESGNPHGRPRTEDSIRASLRRFLLMSVNDFKDYHPKTQAELIAYHRVLKARDEDYKSQDALTSQVDGNPKNTNDTNLTGDGLTLNLGWKKDDD